MALLDRRDAGCWLAERLTALAPESPVVIALPPGGVPVAFEIAQRLRTPLDVLTVGGLATLGTRELTVGAVAEDGTVVVDADVARQVAITEDMFDAAYARELQQLRHRASRYRGDRRSVEVSGRTVIAVDDGLGSQLAELAAVRALRAHGAARIMVAIPVATTEHVATLAREADQIVCHEATSEQLQHSALYEDFSTVLDAEVLALLDVAASIRTPTPGQMPAPERIAPIRPQGWPRNGSPSTSPLATNHDPPA